MAKDKNNLTPNFGRAFHACVNADWAIEENYFRNVMLPIASRLNSPQSVEAYREQPLEKTEKVKVRNGVAIIPITGPIFRYANFFTYYSGGTSVTSLARDFNAALEDPSVYSIMFEINSPGGEVTGINELGNMIYNARKKMPMTARVGGLMCSAALWLGVQAGDVAIDETALVGSIGVMTTYTDDRKWMEKVGLEELEFISSQSPYKNAPPYTDEGRKRIQARLDALCQIFGDAVARGRDVSIKTVWDKFGQGDVFVGQAAIDAGLADRFGSYEETLRLLAKAHTPGFMDADLDDEQEDEEFIEPFEDDDFASTEKADVQTEESSQTETIFISENAEPVPTDMLEAVEQFQQSEANTLNAENDLTSKTDEAEASINPTEEETMKEEKEENTTAAETAVPGIATATLVDFEAREKALADREAAIVAREKEAETAKLEAEKAVRRTEFEKTAAEFSGDKAGKVSFMESLADKFGADSPEFTAYVTDQKALAAQISTGELFKEQGSSGAETSGNAEAKLGELAKAKQKANPGITYEKAFALVMEENPELYSEYERGN